MSGRAAWALTKLGAYEVIPILTSKLDSRGDAMPQSERTAFELAVAKLIPRVQAIGDHDSVVILLELLESNNLVVSRGAAKALATVKAREAIPVLVRILEERGSDLPTLEHRMYIRALREMPHVSAIGAFQKALYRKDVREKAALGLAELRSPEATAALQAAAADLGWWGGRKVRRAIRLKSAHGLE